MPYPAALGHRPLEVDEAYAALTQYAADYGRDPLLLLMHASVPETLRPDLLNLIRVNFLASRGPDPSLEADVLFSPLATALGGGYYRLDAQVRWHGLVMLRSLYRHDPRPRIRRIAELLWRYVEAREHQASRTADPQLAEFLDIQRWVALAFLEPASAAHAFADALRQAGHGTGSVALRLGGLAAAIELPLAGEPELLAYARGLDALAGGDQTAGRRILEALGDGEIRIGDIVLRPGDVLADASPQPTPPDPGSGATAPPRIGLVLGGHRRRPPADGSPIDFDALYPAIAQGLAHLDLSSRRFDLPSFDPVQVQTLLDADLVLGDLSGTDPDTCYQLGLALALRPDGVQLIAQHGSWPGLDALALGLIHQYTAPAPTADGLAGFAAWLAGSLRRPETPLARSPVYLGLDLRPPQLDSDTPTPALPPLPARPQALLLQAQGLRVDPANGRSVDLDDSREALRMALQRVGIEVLNSDDDPGAPQTLQGLLDADLVLADLSTLPPDTLLQLGLRHGLRAGRSLLLADTDTLLPSSLRSLQVLRYARRGVRLDRREQAELDALLQTALARLPGQTRPDSPVYAALPALRPPTPRPARVFMSYPQTYTPYVRPLVAALKGLGVEVSWDMDLSSGEDWARTLGRMLEEADAVVCIAGRDTAAREFPMAEIHRAVELEKRLIPVLVEPIEAPPELTARIAANPERDGRLRYLLDGWRENDFDALVAEIAERIRQGLRAPEPSPGRDAARADGPATRQLSIRVPQAGQLEVECAEEGVRHTWTKAYDPAELALVADAFLHQTPRTGKALYALTDLLVTSPLAGLPHAAAYRLILAPEAVPWPWELMLSLRLHELRQPIPILRRSDGSLFSVLREAPRRALLVHSRLQPDAPIHAGGLDALQAAGFEVIIAAGEPRETLQALTSGDFGLVILSGRSREKDGQAGMLLGDGMLLGSDDLAQLRLTPEVVILHDPEVDHGGLASRMAPALQKAGVRCVVAPAWRAGGPADVTYHDTLLSLLAGGGRFADAHAGAVAACFEADRHDGQWAAYQAWGEPDFRFPAAPPAPA